MKQVIHDNELQSHSMERHRWNGDIGDQWMLVSSCSYDE